MQPRNSHLPVQCCGQVIRVNRIDVDCIFDGIPKRRFMRKILKLLNAGAEAATFRNGWPVINDGPLVGCDKQRAGTLPGRSGVPALRLSHPTNPQIGQPWPLSVSTGRDRVVDGTIQSSLIHPAHAHPPRSYEIHSTHSDSVACRARERRCC